MEFYWELILQDSEVVYVKPEAVALVQRCIASKTPITTPTRSIPFSLIKDFRISERRFSDQKLLEEVSQVFKMPLITQSDSETVIQARWVKKQITTRRWDTFYRFNPSYRKLADESGYVTIAFRMPIHLIDNQSVSDCTEQEIAKLERYTPVS